MQIYTKYNKLMGSIPYETLEGIYVPLFKIPNIYNPSFPQLFQIIISLVFIPCSSSNIFGPF